MDGQRNLLVVSARLDNKKALLHLLEGLPVNVFTASTISQALEVFSKHPILLVFSEENLADGTYRDLLCTIRAIRCGTRLVLMLCTGEWDEYLEALRLGATEVIHCPFQPTDVELILIRAVREQEITPRPVIESKLTVPFDVANRPLGVGSTAG